MAKRAGLRKITKVVRGKKGSVRRSYWVSQGSMSDRDKAKHIYKTGLANAGMGLGANLGRHVGLKSDPHLRTFKPAAAMLGGAAGGYLLGRGVAHTTSRKLSNRAMRNLGIAGHVVGAGSALYNFHKTSKLAGSFHAH